MEYVLVKGLAISLNENISAIEYALQSAYDDLVILRAHTENLENLITAKGFNCERLDELQKKEYVSRALSESASENLPTENFLKTLDSCI